MRVKVRLFARYAEAAGVPFVEVEVPDRATLREVWDRVRQAVPALGPVEHPLFAADRAHARADRRIAGGEEIAAFPPVSGG